MQNNFSNWADKLIETNQLNLKDTLTFRKQDGTTFKKSIGEIFDFVNEKLKPASQEKFMKNVDDEVATEINLLYPKNQSPLEAHDVERIADLMAKDMNGDLKEAINYEKEMNKADVAKKFEFENSDVQSNEATNKQKARKQ